MYNRCNRNMIAVEKLPFGNFLFFTDILYLVRHSSHTSFSFLDMVSEKGRIGNIKFSGL